MIAITEAHQHGLLRQVIDLTILMFTSEYHQLVAQAFERRDFRRPGHAYATQPCQFMAK